MPILLGSIVIMGIHHISWQSTASGLEDEYIHAAALSWITGDVELVEIERKKLEEAKAAEEEKKRL